MPAAGPAYRAIAAPPATSSRSIGSGSTTGRGVDGPADGTLRTGPPEAGLLGGAVVPLGGPLGAFFAAGAAAVAARAVSEAATGLLGACDASGALPHSLRAQAQLLVHRVESALA